MKTKKENKIYLDFKEFRDRVLNPIAYILTKIGLTPNFLSLFGVLFMLGFVLVIIKNIYLSLIFLILSILADGVDGVLARYQKVSSDRGRFIDRVCDNTSLFLFVLGLIYFQILNPVIGFVFFYIITLSKIFRMIENSFYFKSDWLFRTMGGPLPTTLVGIVYFEFLLYTVFNLDYFNLSFLIFSIILFFDSVVFFKKIIQRKK